LVSGHDAMIIIPEAVAALLLEQDRDVRGTVYEGDDKASQK
jgi:hypothetical protein